MLTHFFYAHKSGVKRAHFVDNTDMLSSTIQGSVGDLARLKNNMACSSSSASPTKSEDTVATKLMHAVTKFRAVTKQLENSKSHMTSVGHQLCARSDPHLKERGAEVLRSAEVALHQLEGQLQVAGASRSEQGCDTLDASILAHIATCECHVGGWKESQKAMDGGARMSNGDFALSKTSFECLGE